MPFISNNKITSVVIACAGGFGLEVYDYINEESKIGGPIIEGFIDDTPGRKTPDGIDLPWLSNIEDFKPKPNQIVVVANGSTRGRQIILNKLWHNNIETPAFYHSSAVLSPSAIIKRGVIICPFTIVNRNTILNEGVMLNVHCSIGHGANIGAFSVLCPYSALNGDAIVGSNCFLGTRATIYPKVSIGNDCIVDSHTGVKTSAIDKQMITSRGKYQTISIR